MSDVLAANLMWTEPLFFPQFYRKGILLEGRKKFTLKINNLP